MEKLPNGVEEFLEHLAESAAFYGNRLHWREEAYLKADMMNMPERWLVITPEQLEPKASSFGMSRDDVETFVDFLKRWKQGRKLVPAKGHRDRCFPAEVDTYPEPPPRTITNLINW